MGRNIDNKKPKTDETKKAIKKNADVIKEVLLYISNSYKQAEIEFHPERYIGFDDMMCDMKFRLSMWDTHCNLYYDRKSKEPALLKVNSYGYTYIFVHKTNTLEDVETVINHLMKFKDIMTENVVLVIKEWTSEHYHGLLVNFMRTGATYTLKMDMSEKPLIGIDPGRIITYLPSAAVKIKEAMFSFKVKNLYLLSYRPMSMFVAGLPGVTLFVYLDKGQPINKHINEIQYKDTIEEDGVRYAPLHVVDNVNNINIISLSYDIDLDRKFWPNV